MASDSVLYSRILTELTLTVHIIYATIGVGVPLLILIAHWIGIKKNDEHYILLARRWTRGFVITVAVGVVTGTSIGVQLSLLWPKFMEAGANIIALPLFLETFAFFIEAIFIGAYIYTWDRFKDKKKHLLLAIPIALSTSASAFFITAVNAFMNAPAGVEVSGTGELINIQPIAAMFGPAMPTKVGHVLVTCYMTSAFILASIAAFRMLKGSKHIYHKKALKLTLKAGLIFAIASAIIGDFSGKFLAAYQPAKLAAAEWHFETKKNAPLMLFGTIEGEEVKYAIKVPGALSFLAHNSFSAEVTGLNDIPKDEHPPLYIHYLFDFMVTVGVGLLLLAAFVLWGMKKGWKFVDKKWLMWLLVLGGPLAMITIEIGWWFTEVGRLPWIVQGVMRVEDAATTNTNVGTMLILFIVIFAILLLASGTALIRMFKNNSIEKELADRAATKAGGK